MTNTNYSDRTAHSQVVDQLKTYYAKMREASKDRDNEITLLLERGVKKTEIAKMVNISRQRLGQIIKRLNPRGGVKHEQK